MKRKSRGLRNSRKYARRLGESTIFEFPDDHVEAFLVPSWGYFLALLSQPWANFANHGPS